MKSRFPRIRLVALSTASAAARAGSSSVSTDPTTRWSEPSPLVARDTITTVASKARTALTPNSSKTIPSGTACARACTQACAAQRSSPACEASPSLSPVNASESLHVRPTFARHRPLGKRSSTNSAKRRRSLRGFGADMAFLGRAASVSDDRGKAGKAYATPRLQPPSVQVLGEEGGEGVVGELLGLGEQRGLRGGRERIGGPERLALRARAPEREHQIPHRRIRAALGGDRHVPATVAMLDHSPCHRRLHEVER